MSTSPMTTVDRLRQAIAETLSIDAQGLQAAIGQLVVATSADYPAAGPEARSLHSAEVRTTVLLADRIPAGQEAQALAQEIARHHGQEAAQAVLGERAAELLGGDGKVGMCPDQTAQVERNTMLLGQHQVAMAERAFEAYNFGEGVAVTGVSGWEYYAAGHERSREVYVENATIDGRKNSSTRLGFTVRYDPQTGALAAAYAEDAVGTVFGCLPEGQLEKLNADSVVGKVEPLTATNAHLLRSDGTLKGLTLGRAQGKRGGCLQIGLPRLGINKSLGIEGKDFHDLYAHAVALVAEAKGINKDSPVFRSMMETKAAFLEVNGIELSTVSYVQAKVPEQCELVKTRDETPSPGM